MAEGNPTEFLIENDEKFIGEFIKFMGDNISQYHITDEEVNELSSHLYYGANNLVDGYFGVTINMNLAQYTTENPFSFDFIDVDDLTKDSRLFNNKVKKFMNSINGDKLDTVPSSPKKKGGKRRKKKTRRKKGGMKKRHNIGKKIFKYNPHNKEHPKNKFNIGDTVKMITPLTDDECLFFTYMIDDLTDEKCKELHKDIWEVTKVETDIFNDYTYNIKNKNNFELLARPEETLSKWIEGRTVSIGGRKKKTRKKRGGAPKFLCGPDIDFVPEVHFNELESIFDKLKKDTTDTALKEIVDELPSIRRDKKSGKCIGCKKLIDELVKNTMPSFVGPKILPIKTDKILWLQQFTGVHKGGMCTVMGGRRKKKTHKKKNRKRRTKKKTRRRKKR